MEWPTPHPLGPKDQGGIGPSEQMSLIVLIVFCVHLTISRKSEINKLDDKYCAEILTFILCLFWENQSGGMENMAESKKSESCRWELNFCENRGNMEIEMTGTCRGEIDKYGDKSRIELIIYVTGRCKSLSIENNECEEIFTVILSYLEALYLLRIMEADMLENVIEIGKTRTGPWGDINCAGSKKRREVIDRWSTWRTG